MEKRGDDICPWDAVGSPVAVDKKKLLPASSLAAEDSTAPWESLGHPSSRKNSTQFDSGSSSSDISLAVAAEVSERLKKNCKVQDRFGRRASACTTKTENPRPSVSSMEDFPAPVPTPHRSLDSIPCETNLPVEVPERVRKKSVSGPPGRKQSTSMAPVISVSSVAENTESVEEAEEPSESPLQTEVPKENTPKEKPPKESSPKKQPSQENASKESNPKEKIVNENASKEIAAENVSTDATQPEQSLGNPNDVCPWEDE